MTTFMLRKEDVNRNWYIIDAEGKELGHVAVAAARILRGKNKPEYVPHQNMGDYVIIINAKKAKMSGKKFEDKMYYRHSNFPGGFRATNYSDMLDRTPCFPMEHALKGMLPRGPLGRSLFTNAKVYAGADHPHMAQAPIAVEL